MYHQDKKAERPRAEENTKTQTAWSWKSQVTGTENCSIVKAIEHEVTTLPAKDSSKNS